ncbi:NADH-quinone oxidoreductase subunit L [Acidihalobacter ferrooxydans]|uniref:NADH-quinone oxidoreductase subunit L n=1 Tax=Acidihalobacter ferrooxydans TaxID=1765967 RepID=A0A1P8UKA5_9GAMM|nr:NADH-quinone oxidoreductase subunit L [Acidihalobacter ferrooxydans]APZ44276.1 NADH-quinone oxidoreductase subunit L [Acidihalobacter ferrooxydans]
MNHWLWLIPGAPLLGAALNAVCGGWWGPRNSARLAVLALGVSAASVIALWFGGGATHDLQQTLYTWMAVGDWRVTVGLRVDRVTLVMLSVASWVGFLIHLFSYRFMADDYGERRYFVYLNLFVFGMLSFVLADNLILIYLGWEVMGLCSYALVAHWYREAHNAWCGRKAFVVTRIGDTALALAIFLIFAHYHTVALAPLFAALHTQPVDATLLTWIALLVLLGAAGKSAQLPLSPWLPDAMAGPSTVSALIHAATMVTAGVYLIIRLHPLFQLVPEVLWLVGLVGALTLTFSGLAALGQYDIKRVIAYSTISQIGYMFLGVGIGAYGLALFHLAVHACFKSLLFMSAGAAIKHFDGDHDIRHMGGLGKRAPYLRAVFLAGAMALAAVPLITAAFYSKDAIIEAAWAAPQGWLLWGLAIIGAVLTGAYTFRLYFMVFAGAPRSPIKDYALTGSMKLPLGILAVASIGLGFVQFPSDWPHLPHLLLPWLAPEVGLPTMPHGTASVVLMLLGMAASLLGIYWGWRLARAELAGRGSGRLAVLSSGLYLDAIYDALIVRPCFTLARALRDGAEALIFNAAVVGSLVLALRGGHRALSTTQNGSAARYAALMALGVVAMLGYLLWLY